MVATVLARRESDLTSGGYFRTRLTDEYFNCNAITQFVSMAAMPKSPLVELAIGTLQVFCNLLLSQLPVRFRGSARHPPASAQVHLVGMLMIGHLRNSQVARRLWAWSTLRDVTSECTTRARYSCNRFSRG
jgi:hypothetical protein